MAAMTTASDNAEELITELANTINHYRQTVITNQLTELIGGVEASQDKDWEHQRLNPR